MDRIVIRNAREKDIDQINQIGIINKDFRVSKKIHFYRKDELKEWINNKKNNIFIIAEINSKILGFVYSKIISKHWATVDNFFILSKFRRQNIGSRVERFLEKELKKRKISYLARLVKPNNKLSRKFLKKHGFKEHDKYIWIDKFL